MCNFLRGHNTLFYDGYVTLRTSNAQCSNFSTSSPALVSLFLLSFSFFLFFNTIILMCGGLYLIVTSWMFLMVKLTKSRPFFRPTCLLLLYSVKTYFPRMSFWAMIEGRIFFVRRNLFRFTRPLYWCSQSSVPSPRHGLRRKFPQTSFHLWPHLVIVQTWIYPVVRIHLFPCNYLLIRTFMHLFNPSLLPLYCI